MKFILLKTHIQDHFRNQMQDLDRQFEVEN